MPADRAKVLAALNTKFKGKSVDKNYKESIATTWAAKIADDDGIDDFINDREDDVLAYMKAKDAAVNAATAKAKQDIADKVSDKPEETTEEEIVDPTMPAWAKKLLDQNKTLSQELSTFKSAQSQQSIAERFRKDAKEKGIPEAWIKRSIPPTDADYEAALNELTADYTQFATDNKLSMIGNDAPSGNGVIGGAAASQGKVDSDLASFAKSKSEALTTSKN